VVELGVTTQSPEKLGAPAPRTSVAVTTKVEASAQPPE